MIKAKSLFFKTSKKKYSLPSIYMTEEELQIICYDWLRLNNKYASLKPLWFFNSFQGMKLNGQQIAKAKLTGAFNRSMPDFMFLKNNGTYSSLFIELKKNTPYNKDGSLQKHFDKNTGRDHYSDQNDVLELLKIEGAYACFAWSLNMFKEIVTKYMEGEL